MAERIVLFVGKDDTKELDAMAQEAETQGFITGFAPSDIIFQQIAYKGNEIEVRGGFTNSCVPTLVNRALERGAAKVTVCLALCRDTPYFEEGEHPSNKIEMRREHILKELKKMGDHAVDPRLEILPPPPKKKKFFLF